VKCEPAASVIYGNVPFRPLIATQVTRRVERLSRADRQRVTRPTLWQCILASDANGKNRGQAGRSQAETASPFSSRFPLTPSAGSRSVTLPRWPASQTSLTRGLVKRPLLDSLLIRLSKSARIHQHLRVRALQTIFENQQPHTASDQTP